MQILMTAGYQDSPSMMMASLVRKTWLLTEREDDSTATSKAKEANALTASKGLVICQSVLKLLPVEDEIINVGSFLVSHWPEVKCLENVYNGLPEMGC